MKPSEIISRVSKLEEQAASYDQSAVEFDALAKTKRGLAANARALHKRLMDAIDAELPWGEIEEQLNLASGEPTIEIAPEEPPKRERKVREDKGKPRGPKANAREGRQSPLTNDLRAKLNATLDRGPLQLPEIEKMSWTTGLDVEALLCEDPESFVSWQSLDLGGLTVWGTADQFRDAVTKAHPMAYWHGFETEARGVSAMLGCSVAAAWKAIAQLRLPEATPGYHGKGP